MSDAAWWPFGPPRASAGRVPLLCLPFAGGGASIYRRWRTLAQGRVDVVPVQLPGREGRIRERPLREMRGLVDALAAALLPRIGGPYALFGHSMGAFIGYALSRTLEASGAPAPAALFASAARAPHRARRSAPLHALSDADFTAALKDLQGTPEAVLEHHELMELLLPLLRADFELCETYQPEDARPLSCPIFALAGEADPSLLPGEVEAWGELTTARFDLMRFPGGHFFLEGSAPAILRHVEERLAAAAGGAKAGEPLGPA
ncbi:MAG TPA: alpha/beta fold hydrolase [Candidatus Polarisedimenticolia bacterium]|nr:alpha/beta fold hydrolase [Candidatus Polarisedimenticolia bacterium]